MPNEEKQFRVTEDFDLEMDSSIVNGESPENNDQGQNATALPDEFSSRYKDKGSSDLLKELYESQQMINRQGNELGELRKLKGNNDTVVAQDSVQSKLDSKTQELSKLKEALKNVDDVLDSARHQTISKQIAAIEKELPKLQEKAMDERVEKKALETINRKEGAKLLNTVIQDYGLQVGDDIQEIVLSNALKASGNDEISRHQLLGELMKMNPALETKIQAGAMLKTREEIARASGRVTPRADGMNLGKGITTKMSELTPQQRRQVLKKMSTNQLDDILNQAGI